MSHLPFWQSGSGHYGETLGKRTRDTVSSCRELVLSWLDTIPVKKDGVFTIADYGTNDGFSSMPLIESMIDLLRKKHGDDLPIQIIYEDQEKNDFNSLFNRLCDDTSYLSKFRNVYPLATNVNFYKQCVPDGTCDVIFTSFANHWMETLDMTYGDCVFDVLATKEERARLSVEGERNWTKFLLLRALELKPGGMLVAVNLSDVDKTGQEMKSLTATGDSGKNNGTELTVSSQIDVIMDLEAAWKDLKEGKMITQEEYKRCTSKQIFRTAQECTSPFQKETSAVRQAGLTLVHFGQFLSPCPFKTRWLESQRKGVTDRAKDTACFADDLVAAHRVWSQTTFHSALSDMRTEGEKAAILDELYKKFHARVMSRDIGSYRVDNLMSRLVARKM